jgi:cyclopropane fatty-acyl-phospholipid synthase-like methyltransferase
VDSNSQTDVLTQRLVEDLVAHGHFRTPQRAEHYFERFFGDEPLEGRTLLEIGSGAGWMAVYARCRGARRVIGLEPEASGCTGSVLDEFRDLVRRIGVDQVEAQPVGIEQLESNGDRFDIVTSCSSINHLDEDACRILKKSEEARRLYDTFFGKVNSVMQMGGTLIVTDSSRYNLWATFGMRNPMCPAIEWDVHQTPRYWAKLLARNGFGKARISWLQPYVLERFGRLTKNEILSYFLRSKFRLVMTKVAEAES